MSCFAVYHLYEGEVDGVHFFCSAECRETEFPNPEYPYAVGEGECIQGTICEVCEKEIE
jgi:hypothetical protein